MEDEKIIELYWQRSENAILETDRAYGQKLHSLAERIVQCFEDAQECLNDTYWKAWETIPPQHPGFLFAYLAKICRHFAFGKLDWRNAQKRKAEIVTLSEELALCIPDETRDREAEGKEIARAMNRFLEQLPQESRVICLRRYWDCETVAEIAQRHHFSESKVKTRLHRIRGQLRAYLEKEGIAV